MSDMQLDPDIFVVGAGGNRIFNSATFIAPLDTTIVLARGIGPATYSRASVAYDVDWEGLLKAVLSGEARFYGARRVQNGISTTSEDFSNAIWTTVGGGTGIAPTKTNNYTGAAAPDGTFTACRVQANKGAGVTAADFSLMRNATGLASASAHDNSVWIRSTDGISTFNVTLSYNDAAMAVVPVTGTWRRMAIINASSGAVSFDVGLRGDVTANATADVLVWHPLCESIVGQSNTNPSEYVSVGVLSTPFQGSGVDGVQYFDYQNGNTVASNVVTEARGATIAAATLRGFWREAAATQLVTPTVSIRDMTDASWVKTTMTTARTSVGADGLPNGATRCTASAGNATVIQTLVAAATSRTYSARIRRVTGTGNIELTQDGATFTNIAPSLNSTTYTLVQLNATQLNATFGIRIVTNGDAIDVDFNQFEAGAYATSPMATAGAARAADSLTYPGSNVDVTQGWAYAEVQLPTGYASGNAAFIGTDVGANGIPLIASLPTNTFSFDGTSNVSAAQTNLTTGIRKGASRWDATGRGVSGSGSIATGAFDGSMGNGSVVTAGADGTGGNVANGTIKNARIGRQIVTDTQLQGFTA